MGKKFFYILTVLLFSVSTASADDYSWTLFPMNGGTTSDGIIISTPVLDGFDMINEKMTSADRRKTIGISAWERGTFLFLPWMRQKKSLMS